jgi:hypothetical protein
MTTRKGRAEKAASSLPRKSCQMAKLKMATMKQSSRIAADLFMTCSLLSFDWKVK